MPPIRFPRHIQLITPRPMKRPDITCRVTRAGGPPLISRRAAASAGAKLRINPIPISNVALADISIRVYMVALLCRAEVTWKKLLPGVCRPGTFVGRNGLDCCSRNLSADGPLGAECIRFY